MRRRVCLLRPRMPGGQRFRYDSADFSPERPKIETYRPPDTNRGANWTSLSYLAAFRSKVNASGQKAYRRQDFALAPKRLHILEE